MSTGVDVDTGVVCERGEKTTWKGGLSWPSDLIPRPGSAPPYRFAGKRLSRGEKRGWARLAGLAGLEKRRKGKLRACWEKEKNSRQRKKKRKDREIGKIF